jgi:hypothetical protein
MWVSWLNIIIIIIITLSVYPHRAGWKVSLTMQLVQCSVECVVFRNYKSNTFDTNVLITIYASVTVSFLN